MRAIFWKELSDHFGRKRFNLMMGLVLVGVAWATFVDKSAVVTGGTGSFGNAVLSRFLNFYNEYSLTNHTKSMVHPNSFNSD